jgi:ABC-2 type transport system ATP-binding protein
MDRLLRSLHTESFVLTLRNPVSGAPRLDGYEVTRVDDHTLEVEVSKDRSLNEVFAQLSAAGHEVLSMRNKVNRLEEIFMRLVEKPAGAP